MLESRPSNAPGFVVPSRLQNAPGAVLCVNDAGRGALLRSAGLRVFEVAAADAALALARDERPSLIVLNGNAAHVRPRLEADPATRSIPVLQISSSEPETAQRPFDAWLREPVDPGAFVATARALIRAYEAERRLERAQAAGAEHQQEQLSVLMDSTELGAFDFYPQTGALIASDCGRRHFGLSRDSAVPVEALRRALHPDDRGRIAQLFQVALRPDSGGRYEIEFRALGIEDGKERWLSAWGRVFFDAEGRPERIFGVTLDITARQHAQQALERVLNSISDGLLVLDREWRVTYVSEHGARMIGVRAEALLGACIWDAFPRARETQFYSAYHRAVETGRPVHFEEFYPEPLNKWIECHCYPSSDGLSVYFHDVTERKQAEEALRESQLRYAALFANRNNAIAHCRIVTDAAGAPVDFELVQVNDAYQTITGLKKADVEGRLATVVFPGIERLPFDYIRMYGKVALEGGELSIETFFEALNQWFSVYVYSSKRGEFVIIFNDITERKSAERQLRQSRDLLALAQRIARGGSFEYDLSANQLIWSEELRQLYGIGPAEEITIARWLELLVPEDRERAAADFEAGLRTGEPVSQFRIRRRDTGEIRWFEGRGRVLHDANGEAARMIGFTIDITEHKRAEEEIRRSHAMLQAFFDASPGILNIDDAELRYVQTDRTTPTYFGLTREELVGKSLAELAPAFVREYGPMMRRVMETGEPRLGVEVRSPTPGRNGEITHWLASYFPVPLPEGKRGLGVIGVETTELRKAEARLRQAQKLESIGVLAGGIAHDFNNLLTGILGNASLVLEDAGPRVAERIRDVIASAERAAHLTRQLLAYSGQGQFILREVDVSQAVNAISDLAQFSLPKSVQLSVSVQKRLPRVEMDPGQLQQILMNLVINAGEAIGEGNPGRVTIATSLTDLQQPIVDAAGADVQPGQYVSIVVADTGGGIAEENRSKIFDPFFTTRFTGRGLGLAAVAGILRSRKGGITLTSAPGAGSTFRVLLPAAGKGAAASDEQPDAETRATVLVVDDEATVRDFLGAVLRRHKYRVLLAADGREALTIFAREKGAIDAVVLDVVMPVMSGNQLLPKLKQAHPELKVLLTSGYSEAEAKRLCAEYPGAAFIPKPYTAQQFSKAVEELFAG